MISARLQQLCPPLPNFDASNWDEVHRAFAHCPASSLGQSWQPSLDSAFMPATARFGKQGSLLWMYAELEDADIFNAADGPNQKMWTLGDTLELFLKPSGGETYYEFHITPENHILQLRFPDADAPASGGDWTRFHIHEPLLKTQTLVEAENNRWKVLLRLDLEEIEADNTPGSSNNMLFSVSRYDWTRGQEEPIISSTSPHQKAWFHRQEEWGELVWQE